MTKDQPNFKATSCINKQLFDISGQLPDMPEERIIKANVSGNDLLKYGIKNVSKGKILMPVEIGKTYTVPTLVLDNVNHYKRLKKAYLEKGILGVYGYLTQLPSYEQTCREQYPTHFEKDAQGKYIKLQNPINIKFDVKQ